MKENNLTADFAETIFRELSPGTMKNIQRMLDESRYTECLLMTSQLKCLRTPLRNLDLLRAKAFLGLNQTAAAREALKEELRFFPDNAPASLMLNTLPSTTTELKLSQTKEFKNLVALIQPYTMLSLARLHSLYQLALIACYEDLPGNVVECGVAAGGSAAFLAAIIKKHSRSRRFLYAFDSYEGMPDPGEFDVHHSAHGIISACATGWGAGTCSAPLESLLAVIRSVDANEIVIPVKGYFRDTLPKMAPVIDPIAILHMDGDWHDSTRDILVHLWDRIIPGGLIQIDDFGFWAGCRKAVTDFMHDRGLLLKFEHIDDTGVRLRKPWSAS